MKPTIMSVFAFLPILVACTTGQTPTWTVAEGSVPILTVTTPEDSLPSTSWILVSVGTDSAPDESMATIEFSANGRRMSGWTGCNGFDGVYQSEGLRISTVDMSWTEAGCPDQVHYELEDRMLDILLDAYRYAVEGGQLTITTEDGRELLFFSQG